MGKKSPAALFSDIGVVSGGKKRGFCRLLLRVATPGLTSGLAALVVAIPIATACSGAPRPAVVELYTSQGCSSCPPAEALLDELSKRGDVLAIAFHVDYWDDLGWRDPFSMATATKRQRDFGRTLKLSTVGTPHMIIDGQRSVFGANKQEVLQALGARRPATVTVDASLAEGNLVVQVPPQSASDVYDVYVIGYLPEAVTDVRRGENAGHKLKEVNVARSIHRIGTTSESAGQWKIPLRSFPDDASRALVMLQLKGNGPVASAVSVALR
jgi:hypothetical protein